MTHGVRATSLSLTHTPPKNKPELSRPLRGGADRSSPAISSDHCVTSGCLLGLSGHTPLWWRTSPPCPAQALPPPALSPSCSYLIAGGSTTWKPASLFSSPCPQVRDPRPAGTIIPRPTPCAGPRSRPGPSPHPSVSLGGEWLGPPQKTLVSTFSPCHLLSPPSSSPALPTYRSPS